MMKACSKTQVPGWGVAIACLVLWGPLMARNEGSGSPSAPPVKPPPRKLVDKVYGPLPPPPVTTGDPLPAVENPKFDWGEVFVGEIVKHTYQILNKGTGTLRINEVRPGCRCTVVDYPKEVPPGEAGEVTLSVKTQGYSGRFSRTAIVETPHPKHKRFYLYISGLIRTCITLDPEHPRMTWVPGGEPATTSVLIKRGMPSEPFRIISVKAAQGKLRHRLETVEEGTEVRLVLSTAEDLTCGPNVRSIRETIAITSECRGRPTTTRVSVYVGVNHRIIMVPRGYVYFGLTDTHVALGKKTDPKGEPKKFVTIKSNAPGTTFKITKAAFAEDDESYRLTVETVKEGEEYRVWVEIVKEPELAGGQTRHTAKAEILTDNPYLPKLDLTVYAVFGGVQPAVRPLQQMRPTGNR